MKDSSFTRSKPAVNLLNSRMNQTTTLKRNVTLDNSVINKNIDSNETSVMKRRRMLKKTKVYGILGLTELVDST